MKDRNNYSMSFTTGSLLEKESITYAHTYIRLKDWNKVAQEIKDNNLFQYRTLVATKRILQELKSRFAYLNENAINLIVSGFSSDAQQILWFAICKKHPFIFEFMKEIVREKYYMGQFELTNYDFDAFYNRKMLQHISLEKISDSSRYKLKQVLFKMLREVGIINNQNFIQAVLPSAHVAKIINSQDAEYLCIFTS